MHKLVPRHSLVVGVGPCDQTRSEFLRALFPEYEIISARQIYLEIFGDADRTDMNGIVYAELRRRVALKLDFGERVVVDAPNLRREDRAAFARYGIDTGVPVFYATTGAGSASSDMLSRYEQTAREVSRGDGLADVIDMTIETPLIVSRSSRIASSAGITVVGDVHGRHQPLQAAIAWGKSRGHHFVFLGDIVDYGPDSLETMEEIYKLVVRGEADLILGNHERKIMRWIDAPDHQRLSEGNKITTQAVENLGARARRRWIGRFRGLYHLGHTMLTFGDIVLAHAAVHPGYWTGEVSRRDLALWAMFGEFHKDENGVFDRRYDWVDEVPAGKTVIVGHDIRSRDHPVTITNAQRGTTIFLDTGSGKGGRLSSVDLCRRNGILRIENFNMY